MLQTFDSPTAEPPLAGMSRPASAPIPPPPPPPIAQIATDVRANAGVVPEWFQKRRLRLAEQQAQVNATRVAKSKSPFPVIRVNSDEDQPELPWPQRVE